MQANTSLKLVVAYCVTVTACHCEPENMKLHSAAYKKNLKHQICIAIVWGMQVVFIDIVRKIWRTPRRVNTETSCALIKPLIDRPQICTRRDSAGL